MGVANIHFDTEDCITGWIESSKGVGYYNGKKIYKKIYLFIFKKLDYY